MSDLKPCPFCGGEAFYNPGYVGGNVECRKCGAEGTYELTEAEAIAAWNSRAERTCRNKAIDVNKMAPAEFRTDNLICSACGETVFADSEGINYPIDWQYCPNCGARVVGE